jgi:hypothetical protein
VFCTRHLLNNRQWQFGWYWFGIGIGVLTNQPIPIKSHLLVWNFNTIQYVMFICGLLCTYLPTKIFPKDIKIT